MKSTTTALMALQTSMFRQPLTILLTSLALISNLFQISVTPEELWSKETECWLSKKGVCFLSSRENMTSICPIQNSRTWSRGCPQNYTCCIPPKKINSFKDRPGDCGIPAVRKSLTNYRIVGGFKAKLGQFPWQVMLRDSFNNFFCGGSIIEAKWILTAAHCFRPFTVRPSNPERLRIVSGATKLYYRESTSKRHKVDKIIVHESYNNPIYGHDIALVRLSEPIEFDDYRIKVCLPARSDSFKDFICTVSGFGRYKDEDTAPIVSSYLRAANLPVISLDLCNTTHQKFENPVYKHNLCTMIPSGGRGTCTGDSGGPLACLMNNNQWLLAGVVSWGDASGCAMPNLPSVYTDVAAELGWIQEKIRADADAAFWRRFAIAAVVSSIAAVALVVGLRTTVVRMRHRQRRVDSVERGHHGK